MQMQYKSNHLLFRGKSEYNPRIIRNRITTMKITSPTPRLKIASIPFTNMIPNRLMVLTEGKDSIFF